MLEIKTGRQLVTLNADVFIDLIDSCLSKASEQYEKKLEIKDLYNIIQEILKGKPKNLDFLINNDPLEKKRISNLYYKIKARLKNDANAICKINENDLKVLVFCAGLRYQDFVFLHQKDAHTNPKFASRLINEKFKNNIPQLFKQYLLLPDVLSDIKKSFTKNEFPITVLWGLPGIGKTSLCYSYAATNLHQYEGGCWLIEAAGEGVDFKKKLVEFAKVEWSFKFTDEEKEDEEKAWKCFKKYIEYPLLQNKKHRTLLIFDNVDELNDSFINNANLLMGVHILISTRRKKSLISREIVWLEVNGMSEAESIKILANYREPQSKDDENILLEIAKVVNGFPIALSLIGAQLKVNLAADFQKTWLDLQMGGIDFLDETGKNLIDIPGQYHQKIISVLFFNILEKLTDVEKRVLDYASRLPANKIAISWLEELIKTDYPDTFHAAKYYTQFSNWQKLIIKLKNFSILNEVSNTNAVSMHRLLQEAIEKNKLDTAQLEIVDNQISDYTETLIVSYFQNFIENPADENIPFIIAYVQKYEKLLQTDDRFVFGVSMIEVFFGNYAGARKWIEKGIVNMENAQTPDYKKWGDLYIALGILERALGNFGAAEISIEKYIKIVEEDFEENKEEIAFGYVEMIRIAVQSGNITAGKKWLKKSIEFHETNDIQGLSYVMTYVEIAILEGILGNSAIAKQHLTDIIESGHDLKPNHPILVNAKLQLGIIENKCGNYLLAREHLNECLSICDSNFDEHHPIYSLLYYVLSVNEINLEHIELAEMWAKKAIYSLTGKKEIDFNKHESSLALFKQTAGLLHINSNSSHVAMGETFITIALIKISQKNYQEALDWLEKTAETYKLNYHEESIQYGGLYSLFGDVNFFLKKNDAAIYWYLKSNEIYYANNLHFSEEIVSNYIELSQIEYGLDNYKESKKYLEERLEIIEGNPDFDYELKGYNYYKIGVIEKQLGNYVDAKEYFFKAIHQHEMDDDDERLWLSYDYFELMYIERELGNYYEAKKWLEKKIKFDSEINKSRYRFEALNYYELGKIHRLLGNYVTAVKWLKKSMHLYTKNGDLEDAMVGFNYLQLTRVEINLKNYKKSQYLLTKASTIFKKHYHSEDANMGTLYLVTAALQRSIGDYGKSRSHSDLALRIWQKNYDANHPYIGLEYLEIAITERCRQNYPEAEKYLKKAKRIFEERYENTHLEFAHLYTAHAELALVMQKKDTALAHYKKAYIIYLDKLGAEHPDTKSCLDDIKRNSNDFSI